MANYVTNVPNQSSGSGIKSEARGGERQAVSQIYFSATVGGP